METKNQSSSVVATINNQEIVVLSNEGERFIPVKPICDAMGIASQKQAEKIKEDEILGSVATLRVATGADGKQYEMFCLPLQYIFGWIFTINPKNVNEGAREAVTKYRQECYDVLYRHFFGNMRKQIEVNTMEIGLLEEINQLNEQKSELTNTLRQKKTKLDQIRALRLQAEPELDFN